MSENISAYVETGEGCPFCGAEGNAEDIDAPDLYGPAVSWPLKCTECGRHWTNQYELTGIIPGLPVP